MSGTARAEEVHAKAAEVYSAIEESARLLDVTCSREKVWPILTTYQDGLAEGRIVFSMAAGERHRGELDYSFTGHTDPYALALANGFTARTDHPVGDLLSEITQRCPIHVYGTDCGVVGGFKKTYASFPLDDLQALSKLADIPAMPPSLAENADLFARYGLADKVAVIGIDYQDRTMNVYFGRLPAEVLEPEAVRSLLREVGLPEPSEQMLRFIRKSFSIYPTLSWDSSKVERICFSVISQDAMALPARVEPEIGRFASNAPYVYPGERILVYGSTLAPGEAYYKFGSYYQITPETQQLLAASGLIKAQA